MIGRPSSMTGRERFGDFGEIIGLDTPDELSDRSFDSIDCEGGSNVSTPPDSSWPTLSLESAWPGVCQKSPDFSVMSLPAGLSGILILLVLRLDMALLGGTGPDRGPMGVGEAGGMVSSGEVIRGDVAPLANGWVLGRFGSGSKMFDGTGFRSLQVVRLIAFDVETGTVELLARERSEDGMISLVSGADSEILSGCRASISACDEYIVAFEAGSNEELVKEGVVNEDVVLVDSRLRFGEVSGWGGMYGMLARAYRALRAFGQLMYLVPSSFDRHRRT